MPHSGWEQSGTLFTYTKFDSVQFQMIVKMPSIRVDGGCCCHFWLPLCQKKLLHKFCHLTSNVSRLRYWHADLYDSYSSPGIICNADLVRALECQTGTANSSTLLTVWYKHISTDVHLHPEFSIFLASIFLPQYTGCFYWILDQMLSQHINNLVLFYKFNVSSIHFHP